MPLTALAAALAVSFAGHRACARELTVATWGGSLHEAQRKTLFEPFTAATGVPLHGEAWDGGIATLRSQAEAWDLVQIEPGKLLVACEDGLLEKLDWDKIGGRDRYIPQGVSDCGVGSLLYSSVLAWDRDKFQGTPTWADFWDVAKYPGKRGLRDGVKTNLEIALMADGVSPGDVYRTLRTDDGVDRAFRKLEQLKPYIAWWKSSAQATQFIASGQVLFSTMPNAAAMDRQFGVQWAGSLYSVDSWAVVAGSPNLDEALKFLAFAGDPSVEARLLPILPFGGLAKGANDGLPPEMLANSPSNPANLGAALQIDDQFWRENLDKLSQRYNAWLAR
jgi:putative spermidine/putrescine transport system substrate-binding protein